MNYPVSVKGVLALASGEVVLLMNERQEWELPGGRIEEGEGVAECLAREIREELGVAATVSPRPLDSYLFEVLPGQRVFIVTYACSIDGPFEPVISAEHTQVGVFPSNALPPNLPAGYRASIARWLASGEQRRTRQS